MSFENNKVKDLLLKKKKKKKKKINLKKKKKKKKKKLVKSGGPKKSQKFPQNEFSFKCTFFKFLQKSHIHEKFGS